MISKDTNRSGARCFFESFRLPGGTGSFWRSSMTGIYTARILIAVFLLAVIAGCAVPEDRQEVFEGSLAGSEDGSSDLFGYEMVFAIPTDTDFGYEHETPLSDLAIKRVNSVEAELNCKVIRKYDPSLYDNIRYTSASGVYYCDLMQEISVAITEMYRTLSEIHSLIGISTTCIDYTNAEKWGSKYMLEAACFEDDVYGLVPCLWPELIYNIYYCNCIVNEDLIARLGVEDPREYVEKGQWTWDRLEEVLPLYYREEGGEVIHYSMDCSPNYFGLLMVQSNGIEVAAKNSTGEYEYDFFSPLAMKAMDTAIRIYNTDNKDRIIDVGVDNFIENGSVLGMIPAKYVLGPEGTVCKNMDNFGVIPFPVGPDAPEDLRYFSFYCNLERSVAFSLLTKDIDCAARIVDRMYEPFEEIGGTDGIKKYLANNYFFDDRDAATFYECFANTRYRYFEHLAGVGNAFWDYMSFFMVKDMSVSQYIEATRENALYKFDSLAMPAIRAIVSLWGEY